MINKAQNKKTQGVESEILFSESQKFKQWWIWLILILSFVFTCFSIFLSVFIQHKTASIGYILLTLITPILLLCLFVLFRLETQIRADGIYVRFFPIHRNYKFYKWDELIKCFVREYNPLLEYGGWGIRGLGKNRALNISGDKGLQLQFPDDRKLLIGTGKAVEIKEVLTNLEQYKP